MKTGVNVNGIRWIKEGKTFNCFYQLSSDVELHKTFENVTFDVITNLTFNELLKDENNEPPKENS
jgi:NDP-sugar pyrophosphorylase family protein